MQGSHSWMILSERAMAFTDYTSSGDATASPSFLLIWDGRPGARISSALQYKKLIYYECIIGESSDWPRHLITREQLITRLRWSQTRRPLTWIHVYKSALPSRNAKKSSPVHSIPRLQQTIKPSTLLYSNPPQWRCLLLPPSSPWALPPPSPRPSLIASLLAAPFLAPAAWPIAVPCAAVLMF